MPKTLLQTSGDWLLTQEVCEDMMEESDGETDYTDGVLVSYSLFMALRHTVAEAMTENGFETSKDEVVVTLLPPMV